MPGFAFFTASGTKIPANLIICVNAVFAPKIIQLVQAPGSFRPGVVSNHPIIVGPRICNSQTMANATTTDGKLV